MAAKKVSGKQASKANAARALESATKKKTRKRFHLATSVRNEGLYILEWLAHHTLLGFDSFYIFSNNNTDGSDDLLATLQANQIIDWRPRQLGPDESPQQTAFRILSAELLSNSAVCDDYLAWFDCDEFLVLKQHETIGDLLTSLSFPDGLFINWKSFGSSGIQEYESEKLTIEKFLYWDPETSFNRFGKCISRIDGRIFKNITHHRPIAKGNARPKVTYANLERTPLSDEVLINGRNPRGMPNAPIEYDLAQLNHYPMRSAEEQMWKAIRGPGFHVGAKSKQSYASKVSTLSINDSQLEDEAPKRYAEGVRSVLESFPDEVKNIGQELQRTSLESLREAVRVNGVNKVAQQEIENIQHHTHHLEEVEQRLANAAEICQYLGMVGIAPKSILDIGCGFGFFLAEANKKWQLDHFTGVDGEWVKPETLCIPPEHFLSMDLAEDVYVPEQNYDLTVCLEVAEHLPQKIADRFIKTLTASSDIVLFSAAFTGQGGKRHLNEQPMSYWAKKFVSEGYQPVDILHDYVWPSKTLYPWFRNNLVLFASGTALERYRHFTRFIVTPHMLDRIHPHYFNRERTRLKQATVKMSSEHKKDSGVRGSA